MQRAYLDLVNNKLNGPGAPLRTAAPPADAAPAAAAASGDEKPFYRAELRALNASIVGALAKASDKETRAHLEGARDQIAKILDPKFAQPQGGGQGAANRAGIEAGAEGPCWLDYVIEP